MISIIIPTYNEAFVIGRTLDALSEIAGNFEVLVADGQSEDPTRALITARIATFPRRLRLFSCTRHRALQLNLAADKARGSVLLFLHADIIVPADGLARLEAALGDHRIVGGNFRIAFEGGDLKSRLFSWIYNARRPFGIYYGDSGLFVRRETFFELGGFKPIPIMDDYEFVRRLERQGKTICVDSKLIVSDRRWRVNGVWKTLISWVWIQGFYSLGVSPQRLASRYRPVRANQQELMNGERVQEQEREVCNAPHP